MPSKEMVSLFKGLIGLFDKYRDFPLDISYRDLAVAMSTLEPRDRPPLMSDVAQRMQSLLGGDLKLEKGELVFERADGSQMDIALMAEGYRKLAMLIYLLRYGVVERGSTLFWDEPEANLNPAALKLLAEALYALGNAGCRWWWLRTVSSCCASSRFCRWGQRKDLPARFPTSTLAWVARRKMARFP